MTMLQNHSSEKSKRLVKKILKVSFFFFFTFFSKLRLNEDMHSGDSIREIGDRTPAISNRLVVLQYSTCAY